MAWRYTKGERGTMKAAHQAPDRGANTTQRRVPGRPALVARLVARVGAVLLMVVTMGLAGASASYATDRPTISKEVFGTVNGRPVERYTLTNGRLRVRILTYGGILQTVETPDRGGRLTNVTLGFATLDGYVKSGNPTYFGSTVG